MEKSGVMPPNGGTMVGPFCQQKQMRPASAARMVNAPSAPRCVLSRTATAATPCSPERSTASCIASSPATCPKPRPPSSSTVVPSSRKRRDGRARPEVARPDPAHVEAHQVGAVRLDAAQVGLHEQVGDSGGFVGVDSEPAEDPADGGAEGLAGDGDGGFGHGAGSSRVLDRERARRRHDGASPLIVTRCSVRSAPPVSPITACCVERLSQMITSPTLQRCR